MAHILLYHSSTDAFSLKIFQNEVWSPPALGWKKINAAASFVEDLGDCSSGCITRDCNGEVLLSLNHAEITCKAEGPACLLGLQS